jgi:endonuclease/exonuclease/phosphatase family metal-dependent hydrolase
LTPAVRKRLRVAFWGLLLGGIAFLKLADVLSQRSPGERTDLRLVTVNVSTQPLAVAEALRGLEPDVVFMQETAAPCTKAAERLGLLAAEGSDQCVLSRWPVAARPVSWPGPWQPPQVLVAEHPRGPLVLANARLALPRIVAGLSGHSWYTEEQRKGQYAALGRLVDAKEPVIACGDLNALPIEVDLGPRFRDLWPRWTYGATFPVWLPAARIDQCWASAPLSAAAGWTLAVPSDHRALVVDVRLGGSSAGSSRTTEPAR